MLSLFKPDRRTRCLEDLLLIEDVFDVVRPVGAVHGGAFDGFDERTSWERRNWRFCLSAASLWAGNSIRSLCLYEQQCMAMAFDYYLIPVRVRSTG
jgi:hypothetical protein